MRKAGLVFVVLLVAELRLALGQELPKPLPADDPHAAATADKNYPSAQYCANCHPTQFAQWRISSHAYANVSPMFNKFEQNINDISRGTVNYFCIRCHASVGTNLGERRDIAWWNRKGASQEGITCVTCHRVGEGYGKVNGARRITPGDIFEPVFGPFDTTGVLNVISNAERYKILVSPDQPEKPGYLKIHQTAIQSDIIQKSQLCAPCHQVAVHAGIKLETVWEEWRASPAAKLGITCQECHMSSFPGKPAETRGPYPGVGWKIGPAAIINGLTPNANRKLSDHEFVGPGYPISHPGLFPIGPTPFTPQQWLTFDYRAKWGSDEFESTKAASTKFPPEWQNPADRKTAWAKVQENYQAWQERADHRQQLLEYASKLDGPYFTGGRGVGQALKFEYKLTNLNPGHNLPSGSLGAQPELWLNVVLIDPDGKWVWESGYVDSNGDIADLQSKDVAAHKMPFDDQLFSMQSKFITTNVKGTDREMYLPINLDNDQMPFIRPGNAPTSLLNHPPFARLEKHSIPPLVTRVAKYHIPGNKLTKPGKYKLAVRLRGRTEPIYFMNFVASTIDMKRSENEWVTDTHKYAVEFDVR
jgi:Cytochrome c554 and c-prime